MKTKWFGIYQHCKGNYYIVWCEVPNADSIDSGVIVYSALYKHKREPYGFLKTWSRDRNSFKHDYIEEVAGEYFVYERYKKLTLKEIFRKFIFRKNIADNLKYVWGGGE